MSAWPALVLYLLQAFLLIKLWPRPSPRHRFMLQMWDTLAQGLSPGPFIINSSPRNSPLTDTPYKAEVRRITR